MGRGRLGAGLLGLALVLAPCLPVPGLQAALGSVAEAAPKYRNLRIALKRAGLEARRTLAAEEFNGVLLQDVTWSGPDGQAIRIGEVALEGFTRRAVRRTGAVFADRLRASGIVIDHDRGGRGGQTRIDALTLERPRLIAPEGRTRDLALAFDTASAMPVALTGEAAGDWRAKGLSFTGGAIRLPDDGPPTLLFSLEDGASSSLTLTGLNLAGGSAEGVSAPDADDIIAAASGANIAALWQSLGYGTQPAALSLSFGPREGKSGTRVLTQVIEARQLGRLHMTTRVALPTDDDAMKWLEVSLGGIARLPGETRLHGVEIDYEDKGFAARMLTFMGEQQDLEPREVGSRIASMLAIAALVAGPDIAPKVEPAVKEISAFLRKPGRLKLGIEAVLPVKLGDLRAMSGLDPAITRGLRVTAEATAAPSAEN